MRWKDRQRRVEEQVYDTIEEIADEFDLNVPFYPEVYYVGRKIHVKFDELGLAKKHKDYFDSLDISSYAFCAQRPHALFFGRDVKHHHVPEECAHFLQNVNNTISFSNKTINERELIPVIREALGFFCSLLFYDRKHQFSGTPDIYSDYSSALELNRKLVREYGFTADDLTNFWIHQQGYLIGERVFYEFHQGNFSKNEITRMFNEDFSKSGSAERLFLNLREKVWPIMK